MTDKERIEKLERQVSSLCFLVKILVSFMLCDLKRFVHPFKTQHYDLQMKELLDQIDSMRN